MRPSITMSIRMLGLILFLVGTPMLAIPSVNGWFNRQLFGSVDNARSASATDTSDGGPDEDRDAVPGPLRKPAGDSSVLTSGGEPTPDTPSPKPFTRLPPTELQLDHTRFQSVQQRLQELGADYLVLEKPVGGSGYRFHCRIALPGSSIYSRPFEVHDADPVRAMEQALADVETWCANHTDGTRTLR